MKIEIKVPAMGESISEATVGQFLKPSGSAVHADDEILELETDKVNQVLFAPEAGVINFSVAKGETVKIGQALGYIETEGAAAKAAEAPKKEAQPKESIQPSNLEPASTSSEQGARVTKQAFLQEIGSKEGPQPPKEIPPPPQSAVKPAIQAKGPAERETRRKMSRVRRVIAEKLVEAQRTTAMLTTFNEVDMSQVIALREKYKEAFEKKYKTRLGFMSFFVKAVVSALEAFPDLNSYIEGDEIVHREYYDIGIAVGTDKGLFVPVVRNCDRLTFDQIEGQIENFSSKARGGTIAVDDIQGGGFTITNGGVYGSLLSTPILNPPQSGILGMHKIIKRPVVVDDQIVIRLMMNLALSYDHRIVDGKEAVSFLIHIKNLLEDPARFFLKI